jgi:hypothetical protein
MKTGLFSGGPPTKLYGWIRLRSHAEKRPMSLAFGAALVCWLPPAFLAAAQGDLIGGDDAAAVHSRGADGLAVGYRGQGPGEILDLNVF